MIYFLILMVSIHLLFLSTQMLLTLKNLSFIKKTSATKIKRGRVRCSIIIPARNEVKRIRKCLDSILRNGGKKIREIIVVDDGSTDGTRDLIRQYQEENRNIIYLRIENKGRIKTRNRKAVTLDYAAKKARGEWLLFLDADTWIAKNTVEAVMSDFSSDKNIVTSFIPKHFPLKWWEKCWLGPYLLLNVASYRLEKMYDSNHPHAILIGACWLVNRKTYLSVGGFSSVYSEIVEDYALAEILKKQGYKIQLVDGTELFSLRNYFSLRQLISSAKKGIGTMNINWIQRAGLTLFFFVLFSVPFSILLFLFDFPVFIFAASYYFLSSFIFWPLRKWSSQSWFSYLLYSFGYFMLFIVSLGAFLDLIKHKIEWRGRIYKI